MQLFSRHRRNDEAQVARTWEGGGHRSGAGTGTAAPAGFAAPQPLGRQDRAWSPTAVRSWS